MDPARQPNETFDYYNFIGSITNTSRNEPDGAVDNFWTYSDQGAWSCHTLNATFRGKFTTHLQKQDIAVDNENITLSPLGDYIQNWSDPHSRIAYEMIVRMIFNLLEGAIVHDLRPDSDPQVNAIPTVFRTSIMQTGLIGALNFSTAPATGATKSGRATTDKPIITPEDESLAQNLGLDALIEQLSRNVTVSFYSDTQFWSAPDHGYNTTVTAPYTRNVFWYNAKNLLITYAIALGLTLVSVVAGARAFHYNGVSHSKNFSAMIQMSRNPTLDEVTRGQGLERQPLDETFKETKLRFGILAASLESGRVDNVKPVKIGFGTPEEIIPLDEKAFRQLGISLTTEMESGEIATSERSSSIKWVRTLWGLEARWTVEPDEDAVMATIQAAITLPDPCDIKFLAQGAFNKIFTITSTDKQVVARVTLPIDPKWKTLSEVATLAWVRTNTSLPVPEVFAYNADSSTPIGFEWIAMEMMPGKPWADAYRSMTLNAKEEVVRRIARFNSEIFQKPLQGIGNIFPGEADVQRIVSSAFICHGFGRQDIQRGPFLSSWQWLQFRLDLAELDSRGRLEKAKASMNQEADGSHAVIDSKETHEDHDNNYEGAENMDDQDADADEDDEDENDADDLDVLEDALKITQKLKVLLPEFFTPVGTEPEPTILFHDDLNRHNILVDEAGELTAVVDWECISALPLWAACRYPSFIDGKPNDVEPIKERYPQDEHGQVDELFWEHLEDFESTKLRRLFTHEMQRLSPGWVGIFEASQGQRDFDMALDSCDDEFSIRRVLAWLADIESGKTDVVSLEARFS
ncbi:hypothetical protein LQW54_012607 [Pestalotiopsis sp. IQ-011]